MVLTLGIPQGTWNSLVNQDTKKQEELLEEWKRANSDATQAEIDQAMSQIEAEHPSDYTHMVKEALVNIVNKYLPVNVRYFDVNNNTVVFEQNPTTIYLVYA